MTLSRALATHPQAQAVSAKDVKALREETSAGMMDCKNALVECDGDMEKAGEWLRAVDFWRFLSFSYLLSFFSFLT